MCAEKKCWHFYVMYGHLKTCAIKAQDIWRDTTRVTWESTGFFWTKFGATFNVLKKIQCSLPGPVCQCMCLFCLLVCVSVCTGVWAGGGYYCFLLVAAQSCLSCGTSVGCVMGFVERCSVSGVKQAQSRALPDAMGTSGLVSLRLRTHAHMPTCYNIKTPKWHWYTNIKHIQL